MAKDQSQNRRETGSVLFMALVFLVLTALIAVTIMDTSILSRRMAGNSQFREEAMQIAEGVANETVYDIIFSLKNDVVAPQMGDVICMKTSTDPDCDMKILEISPELAAAAGHADIDYEALFFDENAVTSARTNEDDAGNSTDKFFDVLGSYNGVKQGLSQASLAIGVKARFTTGTNSAQVQVEAGEVVDGSGNVVESGSGSGNYMFNY